MSHQDILKKLPYLYFFDCGLSPLVKVFEADICCVEFLGRSIGTIRYSQKNFPQGLFRI